MAYSNAIFYIDLVNGNDAARAAITGCNFINNGAGVVRMTKVAHGLSTGAIITVSSGTYAGDWLINKIDNDNCDLFISRATGQINIENGLPAINETLTINSNVFTFKATRTAGFEIAISSDIQQLVTNICNAINADISTVTANPMKDGLKLLSFLSGTIGNAYTLQTTSTALMLSGNTLAGGANKAFTAVSNTISVTPYGGTITDPWKTISFGATTARIAPGDIIRVSKTPDPISIGNATWTNNNKLVTLATVQTKTIELCETIWTAQPNVTPTATPTRKQGSFAAQLQLSTSFTTGKIGYKSLPSTLDLSEYQNISFQFRNSANIVVNRLRVCLCSDLNGDVIVDTFKIPAISGSGQFMPLTLIKEGGGNLGNSINSISIYSDITGGVQLIFDNFIACKTGGLNLQSLISKNGSKQGGNEGYYGIQSIDGTTVNLDGGSNTLASDTFNKYYGTSETVETFIREGFKTYTPSSTIANAINESGTISARITTHGGWNLSNNTCDGETFFDGVMGMGNGFSNTGGSQRPYNDIINFSLYRFAGGFVFANYSHTLFVVLSNCCNCATYGLQCSYTSNSIFLVKNLNCNAGYGFYINSLGAVKARIVNCNNNYSGGLNIAYSNNCDFVVDYLMYNLTANIYFTISSNNRLWIKLSDGTAYSIISDVGAINYFYNSIFNNVQFHGSNTPYFDGVMIYSLNHQNIEGNNMVFTPYGKATWQTVVKHDTDPGSWKIGNIQGALTQYDKTFKLKIAEIAFEANKEVSVKAWVKKDHATNVGSMLIVPENPSLGVERILTYKANDTNWQQLEILFTPTKTGVTEIYIEAWCSVGNPASSIVYVGSILVTQE